VPGLTGPVSQQHLVVIDGCDGAGKSTLAQAVAAHHGHAVVHAALTPEGVDLFAKYQAILARPGPLVLDRSFVSESVRPTHGSGLWRRRGAAGSWHRAGPAPGQVPGGGHR
jgi:hypothetical protein